MSHLFGHTFEQMIAISGGRWAKGYWIAFPSFDLFFWNRAAGWVPYWLDRLNEHYEVLGIQVPELKTDAEQAAAARTTIFFLRAG